MTLQANPDRYAPVDCTVVRPMLMAGKRCDAGARLTIEQPLAAELLASGRVKRWEESDDAAAAEAAAADADFDAHGAADTAAAEAEPAATRPARRPRAQG